MILDSPNTIRIYNNWCSAQLMAAAYLITLQGLLDPGESKIFQESRQIDALLDNAETVLTHPPVPDEVHAMSLMMLKNVRYNVALSTERNAGLQCI